MLPKPASSEEVWISKFSKYVVGMASGITSTNFILQKFTNIPRYFCFAYKLLLVGGMSENHCLSNNLKHFSFPFSNFVYAVTLLTVYMIQF